VKPDAAALHAAAWRAAERAAEFLRAQEGTLRPAAWTEKGRHDFVTEVDREAERVIAAVLTQAFPDSVVMGEELSPGDPDDGPRMTDGVVWIVDPLDGTTNFLHGYPSYAVSIAAVFDGEPLAGVVRHVPAGVVYHAVRGGGAWRDGTRLGVSSVHEPRHALIGTGFPFKALDQLPAYLRQFAAITHETAGIRRAGSAALDLCDVAAGRFDGFWELVLSPWDVAAGVLLVREAGGLVTGLAGEADVIRHGPIVAGNATIHAWLLDVLAR
jgi:myo-inositol-1(or 4)-monophosphatase